MSDTQIKQTVAAIASADALLITAGAGIGVDSGLPDFADERASSSTFKP